MPEERQGRPATDPAQLGTYYEAEVPDTLDLADHAAYGINHFTMSISEQHDYEMYWGVQPLGYKPDLLALVGHAGKKKFGGAFGEYNPPIMDMQFSPLFACQAKCIEAMAMERLMSGSRQLLEREARMMDVFTSYLGDDGLHWVPADAKNRGSVPSKSCPSPTRTDRGACSAP